MKILARQQIRFAIGTLVALVALSMLAGGTACAFPITWSLSEFQPNVPNGGRANSIAVNPTNNNDIFVASNRVAFFTVPITGSHGTILMTSRPITWGPSHLCQGLQTF